MARPADRAERNANGNASAADVLPLLLCLAGRRAVVVGAGPVAARKVSAWVQAGADVLVVAPYACEDIVAAAAAELLTWRQREFRAGSRRRLAGLCGHRRPEHRRGGGGTRVGAADVLRPRR